MEAANSIRGCPRRVPEVGSYESLDAVPLRPRGLGNASAPRPLWFPSTTRWDRLSAEMKSAINDCITPLYHELVLEAPSELLKSLGLTITHTAWLEVVEQLELGKVMAGTLPDNQAAAVHQEAIGRCLRTALAKNKLLKTYVQLRRLCETYAKPLDVLTEDPLGRRHEESPAA